jgi:NADPH:quinone reductase-like Zn-dependent oxidoreductase
MVAVVEREPLVVGVVDAVIDLVGGDVTKRSIPLIRKESALISIVSLAHQAATP